MIRRASIRASTSLVVAGLVLANCRTAPITANSSTFADESLREVAFLAGSWMSDDGRTVSEEHWTSAAGGSMVGMNRTIADGRMVFFEYLRIERRENGIVYLASPLGRQPPTAFRLVEHRDNTAIFENPQHDFPQRIIYRRNGRTMRVRIEGQDGKPASEEWTWHAARLPQP